MADECGDDDTVGSAESISSSYWYSRGYDPNYAHAMKQFLSDLDRFTRRLMEYDPALRVTLFDGSDDTYDVGLFYDESLFPIWKKFAIALRNTVDDGIYELIFECIEMPPVVWDMLAESLKGKELVELGLVNNNFGRDGILSTAEFLEGNSTLLNLTLTRNRIDNAEAATRLSMAIGDHPSLLKLYLEHCGIGDNIFVLPAFMSHLSSSRTLKYVYLSYNHIGADGAAQIAEFLNSNPLVETLDLDNNCIGDEGAVYFAQTLANNTNLRHLSLENNSISRNGAEALIKSIFDTSSLNALVDSNHTCWLDVFHCIHISPFKENFQTMFCDPFDSGERITRDSFALLMECSPEEQQKRKIFLAIHTHPLEFMNRRSFNIKYFNDVPLELIPDVLYFLQKDPSEKLWLTNLFELLRGWKMPLLFSDQLECLSK